MVILPNTASGRRDRKTFCRVSCISCILFWKRIMLVSKPALNLCPNPGEVDRLWIRQKVKRCSFNQEDQPGRRAICIKVRTEQPLLKTLAQNLLQVAMPPLLQPCDMRANRRVVQ